MLGINLNDKVDCESLEDFWQYYRGQYFGLKTASEKIDVGYLIDRDDAHVFVGQYNGDTVINLTLTWETLKGIGLFGNPILGTTEIGPTYVYIYANARRESIKGLSMPRIQFMCPNHDFVFNDYGKKKPYFQRALTGNHLGTLDELKTVYSIYNKKYFEWKAAIRSLEQGKRLGFPISRHCGVFLDPGNSAVQLSYKSKKIGIVNQENPRSEVILHRIFRPLVPILSHLLPTNIIIR